MDEQRFAQLQNEYRIRQVNDWFQRMGELLASAQRDLANHQARFNQAVAGQAGNTEPVAVVGWAVDLLLGLPGNLRVSTVMQEAAEIRRSEPAAAA